MKIGIIADIHADLLSLIAALELLHKKGVEHILCAGDLVDKGADGDAVVETIKTKGIPSVIGNHDRVMRPHQVWLKQNLGFDPHIKARLLTQATLDYIDALPPHFKVVLDEVHIVVAHGIPSDDTVYLHGTGPRRMFENALDEARHIDPDVKVLIVGHTHAPLIVRLEDCWILNSGSVAGQHTDGSTTCAVLNLPDCKFEVYDLVTGMRIVPPLIQW